MKYENSNPNRANYIRNVISIGIGYKYGIVDRHGPPEDLENLNN
jgi:hypothetical protein